MLPGVRLEMGEKFRCHGMNPWTENLPKTRDLVTATDYVIRSSGMLLQFGFEVPVFKCRPSAPLTRVDPLSLCHLTLWAKAVLLR